MKVTETCPLCGSRGEVTSVGAFGYVASCGDCHEADPEAARFRHLQGHAPTEHEAVERWLEEAREYAALEEIPKFPCSYTPVTPATAMFLDLEIQVRCEAQLQRGFELVEAWRWWPSHDHTERKAQDILYLEFPQ